MVLMDWEEKSGLRCPLCGYEMTVLKKDWYEERKEVKLIGLECRHCHLEIKEYSMPRAKEDGEKERYELLREALYSRVKRAGVQEV